MCSRQTKFSVPSPLNNSSRTKSDIRKRKSPLQAFDEIATRELLKYQVDDEKFVPVAESGKKWSSIRFSGSKASHSANSKISLDKKVSRITLHSLSRSLNRDTLCENAALMDAIDKLAQAEAICRFDAAVKAAEMVTSSVPPELAEEAAIAKTMDYESEIFNFMTAELPGDEERRPMEVIAYIGITKERSNAEDESDDD